MGYGLWVMGYGVGVRDMGYGVMGYGGSGYGLWVRVGVHLTGAEEVKRPEDLHFRDGGNGVVSHVTIHEFHAILLDHRVVIGAPLNQSKKKAQMTAGVEYLDIYI